jgi:xanthine dehydrogenase accessory factor
MRDVLPDIEKWRARGEKVALATVVSLVGSAPRRPGAKLAISESGELAGSVSGGCVEAAVIEAAFSVIKSGQAQMLAFGITKEDNIEQIGLACAGTIHVFIECLDW